MKKIIVTGGTGFIGKAVVNQLIASGYEPFIFTRNPNYENEHEIFCDIWDETSIKNVFYKIRPDTLIHLAWDVEPSSYLHSDSNIKFLFASMLLMKYFKDYGGKHVLMAGTCFEYEFSDSQLSEESPINPNTLYASTKVGLYLVAKQYAKQNGLIFSWMRFFYLFGENENKKRVVPYIITSLMNNQPITCKNSGAVRDYIYVQDAAKAVVTIMEHGEIGIYNIGSGNAITMKDIFSSLARIMGKEHLVTYENQEVTPQYILADISKLNETGYSPSFSLDDALVHTLDWWKTQII